MNYKTRFLVMAGANVLLLMAMFAVLATSNIDLNSRLVDLNLSDPAQRNFLLKFMGVMLSVFAANLAIGVGRSKFSQKEVDAIAHFVGDLADRKVAVQ